MKCEVWKKMYPSHIDYLLIIKKKVSLQWNNSAYIALHKTPNLSLWTMGHWLSQASLYKAHYTTSQKVSTKSNGKIIETNSNRGILQKTNKKHKTKTSLDSSLYKCHEWQNVPD